MSRFRLSGVYRIALLFAVLTVLTAVLASAAPGTPPVINRAAAPPAIDGVLDDECWQQAARWPLKHYNYDTLQVGGQVAVCYDDQYLYAAFWLDEPETDQIRAAQVGVNEPELWNGEVVEWFIEPQEGEPVYFHLAWNPAGSQYNARCSAATGGNFTADTSWRPEWECAGVIGENGWTAEAAISFAELGITVPADGETLRFNLGRTRQIGEREFSAMAPTGGGGFHQPNRFARVWLAMHVARDETVERSEAVTALIGHRMVNYHGYGSKASPNAHLDRALQPGNVAIRVCGVHSDTMLNWPPYSTLAQNHVVILADVPAKKFSPDQIEELCRYVDSGGTIILLGPMVGWRHDEQNSWLNSPFMAYMPLRPAEKFDAPEGRIQAAADNPLFKNIALQDITLTALSPAATVTDGATVLSTSHYLETGEAPVPFIAEKRTGEGRVIHVNFSFSRGQMGTWDKTLFVSPYYPVFWDNLLEYATGRPVLAAAQIPPLPVADQGPALVYNLLADNQGDMFKPGGTVRLSPQMRNVANFPYSLVVSLSGPQLDPVVVGSFQLEETAGEHSFTLPDLDRGTYTLHLEARKGNETIAETRQTFAVRLPLIDDDAFPFMVYWEGDALNEDDQKRIAAHVKSIGFDAAGWLGGILYGRGYDGTYRLNSRFRFASRLQEAGLQVQPVWYPVGYEIHTGFQGAPGSIDRASGLPKPDPAFPDEHIMPWFSFWQDLFADRMYGKMPLTAGFSAHDEIIARSIPLTSELVNAYGKLPTPGSPGYYDFLSWHFRLSADFVWFARAICEAHNPKWAYQNIVMPNSLVGHSGCLTDMPNTLAAHGWMSPDVYHYGEGKLYHKSLWSMSAVWSATDFGKQARAGFTGGQLSNLYYETFPEQVFGALTTGATFFNVFSMPTVNIMTDGRPDERFAEISRRTTREAGRIGRVLNHHDRSRARVAMLYPQATYFWDSYEDGFRQHFSGETADITEGLEGYAEFGDGGLAAMNYLQRRYALKVAYHLLRETAGHVDIIYDSQVRRGDLNNYDVVVLAYAPQVEEATLRLLRRYMENGGMVLVTTDSGQLNHDNLPTDALYGALPVTVDEQRPVSANYADTRMNKPEAFSIGHGLVPAEGAEVYFNFPDGVAACVRGRVGRGEAVVLGMPLAALLTEPNHPKRELVEYVINRRAALISRPDEAEFSAITFLPRRGDGRIFMLANHGKEDGTTQVSAWGDESLAGWTLADIVTGETLPFTVEDGLLTFNVSCPGQWGRALTLLDKKPTRVAVGVSGAVQGGSKLMIAARVLGPDSQPVHGTLPLDVTITDPSGTVREDLSGVRVAQNGVWVYTLDWPVNAVKGQWTVSVSEVISGHSEQAHWQAD